MTAQGEGNTMSAHKTKRCPTCFYALYDGYWHQRAPLCRDKRRWFRTKFVLMTSEEAHAAIRRLP